MVKNEKVSVLKLLIENKETKLTIREISIKRKINYKSAYEAIKKLEKEGNIKIEKKGNTSLCSFTNKLTNTTYVVEKERLKETLEDKDIKIIHNELYKINKQFITLLFGSRAKKKQTKKSDIDLLIISETPEEIEEKISWIPKNLHVTSINYEDFIEMLQTKKFNVVNEAIKNNIILTGMEDYYRLIENAKR